MWLNGLCSLNLNAVLTSVGLLSLVKVGVELENIQMLIFLVLNLLTLPPF